LSLDTNLKNSTEVFSYFTLGAFPTEGEEGNDNEKMVENKESRHG
jgi:hypothetical protein